MQNTINMRSVKNVCINFMHSCTQLHICGKKHLSQACNAVLIRTKCVDKWYSDK